MKFSLVKVLPLCGATVKPLFGWTVAGEPLPKGERTYRGHGTAHIGTRLGSMIARPTAPPRNLS